MSNYDTINVPFSTQLTTIMAARGITQRELARKIGVSRTIISRYSCGLRPSPKNVQAIEAALNIQFNDPDVQAAFAVLAGNGARQ